MHSKDMQDLSTPKSLRSKTRQSHREMSEDPFRSSTET